MSLIAGYPEGSDITLINTIYLGPRKDVDEKWDNGSITIVFKDNTDGKKHCVTMENPDYEYYTVKNNAVPYNRLFAEKEDLIKHTVPYTNLVRDIAYKTNNEEFYKAYAYQDRQRLNELHLHPNVFSSDMNIEDQYRARFAQEYQNNITHISKSYLDIEADTINMKGDFPEMGECPINAVSVIFEDEKQVHVFLLRDKYNPMIAEFEAIAHTEELQTELKAFIQYNVGGWKEEIRFGLKEFKYYFHFFDEDDEIMMLAEIFRFINTFQPDFLMAWNMGFDIPYIIERILKLGYRPEELMCHTDFAYPVVRYWIDERSKNEYAERGDFATIASYTVYLDQMIHFASRRKGQSAFSSFGLDYIGQTVAKVRKIDYSDITTSITELPRKNYKLFVFYNIFDTIVQKCVEKKTEDLEYVFSKCNINNTRYSKCHRQTVYLSNRAAKVFNNEGFIIGNNVNKMNPKMGKFPGAFVADPSKLNDYSLMTIDGHPVKILANTVDFDYASLYPSLLREFNMAPNTQIGMVTIDHPIWDGENRRHEMEKYTRGGEFFENLQSRVYLEFCKRWMHLGGFMDVYNDIKEFFTLIQNPNFCLQHMTPGGRIIPFTIRNNNSMITPFVIKDDKNDLIKPFLIQESKNADQNYKVRGVLKDAEFSPKQIFMYGNK